MTPVPVALLTTSAAVAVNMWLGWRIGQLRHEHKISVGDGGQEHLLRRMRAQANFVENAPIFLILVGALELSGVHRWVLGIASAVFMLARISHAYGMDAAENRRWRMLGMTGTALANVVLAVWALFCVVRSASGGG